MPCLAFPRSLRMRPDAPSDKSQNRSPYDRASWLPAAATDQATPQAPLSYSIGPSRLSTTFRWSITLARSTFLQSPLHWHLTLALHRYAKLFPAPSVDEPYTLKR